MTLGQTRMAMYCVLVLCAALGTNLFVLQSGRRDAKEISAVDGPHGLTAITPAGYRAIEEGLNAQPASVQVTDKFTANSLPPIEDTSVTAAQVIRGIQRELAARGYEAGVQDGVAGLMTRAAVMAYEHDHDLPLTGEPNDQILNHIVLGTAVNAPILKTVNNRRPAKAVNVIKHVQAALKAKGYEAGVADGKLTPQTTAAIKSFEKDNGMKVTGRISGEIVGKLASAAPAQGRQVNQTR